MKYYEVYFHIQYGGNGLPQSSTQADDTTASDNTGMTTGGETATAYDDMLMQNVRDVVAACAGEAGFETFEDTPDGLKGYVQTALFDSDLLRESITSMPFGDVSITFDVSEAEDKDWNETWENEGFEPIIVDGRCAIHDGRHLPETGSYDVEVEIDARMAFGTGTHETTRMVAATLLDTDLTGRSVLDCGCGTGILGIVALKRGADKAVGYDIDEWSADNARHNAVINRVDDRYLALLGDASVLENIDERFDVVMANINRNILLADMPSFRRMMKSGAILVISGFYTDDISLLTDRAASLGLRLTGTREDNGWACMVLRTE